MFGGLENPVHLLILALIVLLLFGPKRLPELGRSLGSGIRHFRDSLGGGHDKGDEEEPPPPVPASTSVPASPPAPSTKPAPEPHEQTPPRT
jgi:sec-independent protein translocase protein TatA